MSWPTVQDAVRGSHGIAALTSVNIDRRFSGDLTAAVEIGSRRPDHQVDRALHDRFELLARRPRPGADRDGVDGRGGELREDLRIGRRRQLALLAGAC